LIKIDDKKGLVTLEIDGKSIEHKFDTPEAFKIISDAWLKCGWDTKYVYSFSWLGRPIIQLPEDMLRIQEIIHEVKPTVVIETGVAHGGSLIYYASILKAMDIPGKVVGIDIDIRAHNRKEIEKHNLYSYIELIEGSSVDQGIVEQVSKHVNHDDTVLVILDSCHSKQHVLDELICYSDLVTKGSYIVATDGIMGQVIGRDRTEDDWDWNNPEQAALDFVKTNSSFEIVEPMFPFNESVVKDRITYWPNCYVKRVK
jgi:cephalosporin hydroxylase